MKLKYDKEVARVVTLDNKLTAFDTSKFNTGDLECDDEVVENVVNMFNEGKTLEDIDDYLLDECKCTQDAREVIVEGLYHIYYFLYRISKSLK